MAKELLNNNVKVYENLDLYLKDNKNRFLLNL